MKVVWVQRFTLVVSVSISKMWTLEQERHLMADTCMYAVLSFMPKVWRPEAVNERLRIYKLKDLTSTLKNKSLSRTTLDEYFYFNFNFDLWHYVFFDFIHNYYYVEA